MLDHLPITVLLRALQRTGELLDWPGDVEILLIGGAAGLIAGWLPNSRTTIDCDVIRFHPQEAHQAVVDSAGQVARELDLPDAWLSDQAARLNILPDGWRSRRRPVGHWGKLHVLALSRKDYLALKVYAGRPQDRQDVVQMGISREEAEFVERYLKMLTVPSRQANLDQVRSAQTFLAAIRRSGLG